MESLFVTNTIKNMTPHPSPAVYPRELEATDQKSAKRA